MILVILSGIDNNSAFEFTYTLLVKQYGLDTSEFTYNPSESGRHPQAATQPAEEGSRCIIM